MAGTALGSTPPHQVFVVAVVAATNNPVEQNPMSEAIRITRDMLTPTEVKAGHNTIVGLLPVMAMNRRPRPHL